MKIFSPRFFWSLLSGFLLLGFWSALPQSGLPLYGQTASDPPPGEEKFAATPPGSVQEARSRARLLHETVHGALQVVHRDFFNEEKSLSIPSRTLEDVFEELKDRHGVTIRWLAVNATAMSVDNKPQGDFELRAVKAIADGQREYEAVEGDTYRFAGKVRLFSECLKCHLPLRTSTKERSAGLLISMPIK